MTDHLEGGLSTPSEPPSDTVGAPASRRELREREGRMRPVTTPAPRPARASTRPSAPRPSARRASAPAPRPRTRRAAAPKRSIGSRLLSVGALFFSVALLVGVSVPANAFFVPGAAPVQQLVAGKVQLPVEGPTQSLDVPMDVAESSVARDGVTVMSWAEILKARYANVDYSYTVGSGAIRWPFPWAVPISDGFGERISPCSGCSSMHQGVDFLPGRGAPIYAVADGVVTDREDGFGGFGNYVVITHIIAGQKVTSTYAHMQTGSSAIVLGQTVQVGEFLGLVGSTGAATGPHLHFEIAVEDVKVDPFSWLKAHAG